MTIREHPKRMGQWQRRAARDAAAPVAVGIIGLGNVGRRVASLIDDGAVQGARLVAVSSRRHDYAEAYCAGLSTGPRVVSLKDLCNEVDIVIEAATAEAFPNIARHVLGAGRSLVMVSTAGVPRCPEFLDLVERGAGQVRVASGALPGLDLIRSAAVGTIRSARLRSTVLPSSFSGEAALGRADLSGDTGPALVFQGTARDAAEAFPRHFNVAISLALAGVPLDLLRVELWVNPALDGPTVEVDIEADDVALSLMSRNLPSPENPRTSRIIAPSVIAALRGMIGSLQSGS